MSSKNHFSAVEARLSAIVDVFPDNPDIARGSIEQYFDENGEPTPESARVEAEIIAALGSEYRFAWTGDSNGDQCDFIVALAGTE